MPLAFRFGSVTAMLSSQTLFEDWRFTISPAQPGSASSTLSTLFNAKVFPRTVTKSLSRTTMPFPLLP